MKHRVFCSIKEKDDVKKSERVAEVLTGLHVNGLDQAASEGETGLESSSGQVGFDWNWPPWEDIPDRYQLIGTTSLAFVICNMDKVVYY